MECKDPILNIMIFSMQLTGLLENEKSSNTKKLDMRLTFNFYLLIGGQFYLIIGSKNVHMMIAKYSDLDQYKDGRFLVSAFKSV